MNPAVAIAGIVTKAVVELAAILTGGRILLAAIPQLRMSAPKDPKKGDGQ